MIAVISDIHGNLEALQAVLDDIGDGTIVCCAGDVVGYGPNPNECCELVRDSGIQCVQGNHDYMCTTLEGVEECRAAPMISTYWTRSTLTDENRDWLLSLPVRLDIDGITLVHGFPGNTDDETRKRYLRVHKKPDAPYQMLLRKVNGRRLALGHTHFPFAHGSRGRVFNPGSVGQPRDGDWRACYATLSQDPHHDPLVTTLRGLLGWPEGTVRFHRVPYDVESTIRKIEEAGLPARLGERLLYGGHKHLCRVAYPAVEEELIVSASDSTTEMQGLRAVADHR